MKDENINTALPENSAAVPAGQIEKQTSQINMVKDAGKEQNEDEEEETLNLTKPGEEDASWISHWPLLTALLILLVMLTLQFGFKYEPILNAPMVATLIKKNSLKKSKCLALRKAMPRTL